MPTDVEALYRWLLAFALAYTAVAFLLNLAWHGSLAASFKDPIRRAFDGLTFGGSLLLLIGIYDSSVLKLLGDLRGPAIIAGIAGVSHALQALDPRQA